jgi:phospholipase/carboxylesterase
MSHAKVALALSLGLSLSLGTVLGCDRTPKPTPEQPSSTSTPEPAPSPAPRVEPPQAPAAPETVYPEPELELPAVAGVHYLELVTGGADPEAELPMIVALHGNGAYPRLMEYALVRDPGSTSDPAPPFDAPARLIFLRGTELIDPPGHARWFSITANEAQSSPEQLAALSTEIESVAKVTAAAIDELARTRPTRGKPILTGHSQGGILTFGLAILHPELFAAAYPLAGWLPQPLWPDQPASGATKQLKIVALHGADDTVVSFERSREAITTLEQLGYTISLHPYPGVAHALGPLLAETRKLLAAEVAEE